MRAHRLLLAGIVVAACAVRLIYLWQASDDLFFANPIIDPRQNLEDARYLVERSWLGPPLPYWKPPLYAYLLAGEMRLFGDGPWAPRLVQVAMDAASCLAAYSIAARLFSQRVGYVAAAAVALSGALVYFSGELVSGSLAVLLDLLFVRMAIQAWDRRSARWWCAAGVLAGLAALARAEALLFVPALMILLLASRRRFPGRERLAWAGALLAGAAMVVAPVTFRNATIGHDAVLISANGGVNFYIGAAPEYGGMVGVRPGAEWERLVREPESVGIDRVGSRHSAYFVRWALRRAAAEPFASLRHLAKKIAIYWHGHEVMSNRDLYRARETSWMLRALLWSAPPLFFPFGLLAPLGLLGMALAVRNRHPGRALILFVAISMLATVAFFVTARFRLPVVPVLAMFAAYAIERLVQSWRAHERRPIFVTLAVTLALTAVVNLPRAFATDRERYARAVLAEEHHYRGTVLFDRLGRHEQAVAELRAAIAIVPGRASSHFNLAQTFERMGRPADAMASLLEVLRVIDRESPGERNFEGDVLQMMARLADPPRMAALHCLVGGDPDCAVAGFQAPEDSPLLGRALLARAAKRLGEEHRSEAAADLAAARNLRPEDAMTRLLSALVWHQAGQDEQARQELAAFRLREWPRGTFCRTAARRQPSSALDRELLSLLVALDPDDRLAQQALTIVGR